MAQHLTLTAKRKLARAATIRALSAPMTRIPMVADPAMPANILRDDHAHRARRAIQYAAWLGQRSGQLPADLSALDGEWNEQDGVALFIRADASQEVAAIIPIPRHVLDFDPGAPALALPAPEVEPERCHDTVDMLAPALPARPAPAKPARQRAWAPKIANDNRRAA